MDDNETVNIFIRGLKAFDVIAMGFSFGVAAILTLPSLDINSFNNFLSVRLSIGNLILFTAMLIVWGRLFSSFGIYSIQSLAKPGKSVGSVVVACVIGTLVIALIALVARLEIVTPTFLALFFGTVSGVTVFGRFALAEMLRRSLGGLDRRPNLLIVGINSRSIQLANDLRSMPQVSHRLIGFVDDSDARNSEFEQSEYERVSDIENLPEYLRATPVDEVLISLPMKSRYDDASMIVSLCEEQGIKLKILADLFQYRMTHSRAEQFGNNSVITVAVHSISGTAAFLKRCIDILFSFAGLVVLSPVFLLTATVIKIGSPGPVFFYQDRIGLNKKTFRMFKFRTMVVEAEQQQAAIEGLNEATGPVFKIRNDPRITEVGKILRRTSLDELPQLINVFKGEMSLVGPRPLPLRDYAGFSEDWHRRRVSVRPGITGLWQVESRDHSSFDWWMKLDMQYIEHWSLWLDIKILVRTIPAVLRGSGN